MKKRFISIFIILIMLATLPFSCYAFNPTFKPKSILRKNEFVAYYTINAATITLANGQVISSAKVTGGSENTSTITMCPVDIVLIVDTSGSMSRKVPPDKIESRLDVVKNALAKDEEEKGLVHKFFNSFPNSRISLISFNSSADILTKTDNNTGFVDNNDDGRELLINKIKALSTSGGTNLMTALAQIKNLAFFEKEEDSNSQKTDPKRVIITLTDGETSNMSDCATKYKDFLDEGYLIYNIGFEGGSTQAFRENGKKDGKPIGSIYDAKAEDLDKVYNDIFTAIRTEVINSSIDEEFTLDCENAIILDDKAQFTLDYELSQGALLTVEYLLDIKPGIDCTSITITDKMGNFSYNPDSKLLTEDRTNYDEGWKSTNDSSVWKFHSNIDEIGDYPIHKNEDFQKKIVLTKIININSEDKNVCDNLVEFSIEGKNSKGEKITYSTENLDDKDKFNSTVCVIPPLGSTDNYDITKLLYAFVFVLIVTAVIIINIKFALKRKNKK